MNKYFDLSDFDENLDGLTAFQIEERYTGIAITYFSKLFGEILFLDWKENKNGSCSYYIHDRENIEGVIEIPFNIFAIFWFMIKKNNPKYYDELVKKYVKEHENE